MCQECPHAKVDVVPSPPIAATFTEFATLGQTCSYQMDRHLSSSQKGIKRVLLAVAQSRSLPGAPRARNYN